MNFRKENKTEGYWEKKLSKKEFDILRQGGTELPYTGKYYNHFEDGIYVCKGCQNLTKFSRVEIPYACKLMLQEVQTMSIAPRLITERIDHDEVK